MLSLLNIIFIAVILFLTFLIWIFYRLGIRQGSSQANLQWQEKVPILRTDIANAQRANIKGKVAEAFAPFLPDFPYKPSECKFIGDPIDYLVFEGLNERDVKAIHFLEVKSDKSKLSKHQKQIKDIVDSAGTEKITFKEFNFKSQTATSSQGEDDEV